MNICPRKNCTSCEEWKDLTNFYKSKTGKDGKYSICKKCISTHYKKYYRNLHPYKIRTKGINIEEKNGQWKGDRVGYSALHEWVANHSIKPIICNNCKEEKPLDLANISGKYLRDLSDWEWLCRKCHMMKDGRLNKLHESRRNYVSR